MLVLFTSEFVSQNTSHLPGRFALYVLLLHTLLFIASKLRKGAVEEVELEEGDAGWGLNSFLLSLHCFEQTLSPVSSQVREASGEPLGSQAAFEVLCDLPGKAAEEVQSSVMDSCHC